MQNPDFFQFETEFIESLRCIPMIVRMKLDTCGVKLKLEHWHKLNLQEKESIIKKPCVTPSQITDYRQFIQELVTKKTGSPASLLEVIDNPPWLNTETIHDRLQEKLKEFDKTISLQQWQDLTALQRFALIKLSRPSHENRNFLPALKEFNLA